MPPPGKELFSSQKDIRGSFQYGTNRQVEITLNQELDDIARKSLTEIKSKKHLESMVPMTEEEYTSQ